MARPLGEHHVDGLPVTDAQDRVIGVVFTSDLADTRPRAVGPGGTPGPCWVRPVSRMPGVRGARTAGDVMAAPRGHHGSARLPVVDEEDRLVGIVTRGDLPQVVLRADGGIERTVRRDALGTTHGPPPALAVAVEDGVVPLTGRLERRSDVDMAVRAASRVDGVVAVVDQLSYAGT
ncbi:CBS domain-containing protein [Streptomyces werraensis]|uniref:CBS domain-containing protein n=1 Tax=Streptomyces werraensis TaxID=68284 RepID=UPI003414590C